MKFYHWTSKENRKKIKAEWCLFWVRNAPSRCTYLAVEEKDARQFWEIILEVEYDVNKHPMENNYCEWCWQVRVYEPIPIGNCKVISEMEHSEWEMFMRDRADKTAKTIPHPASLPSGAARSTQSGSPVQPW